MEAAPRLPMISFDLKTSTEPASFGPKLKQYITAFYREDGESYAAEVHQLEQLRAAAVRPSADVQGVQTLKRYYCQLRFLRARFPMDKGGACAVGFSWRDPYADVSCQAADLGLELMSVLYNVGALHSQLGAADARQTADGMKMACTHFQCAAWALREAREAHPAQVAQSSAPDLLHFMELACLAQAQECILEKSMSDSRKCTIIAKVAAQAVDYYEQAAAVLDGSTDVGELCGARVAKDWCRYLRFKAAYHGCVSLLYQGQQSEEQQKMGERCALYQAAAERLEEARRLGSRLHVASIASADVTEALAFTQDVVEGKRKAARNENEFIYHETVPERDSLPALQGASLVRPVPLGVGDPDVSGADIFGRLVPMEAHEASSVYSERKAELLRQTGAAVEQRDRELDEFMGSLHHVDVLVERLSRAQTVPQELVDRAAALSARPQAAQLLVDAMGRLSAVHHDVDALLDEAQALIDGEREAVAGQRGAVLSMPLNDLSREAAKYREALGKASDSNEALHRAMTAHVANLRVLGQPLAAVERHLPRAALPDGAEDAAALAELRRLLAKVDEMRQQRAQLVAALREAARADDITARLAVARERRQPAELERLFESELAKHRPQAALIEQNLAAQQNILLALTDAYARLSGARKHVADAFRRRDQTVAALVASYDAYEDLLAKANKGIEFYQKLETNVTKLLHRLRSTCRVQQEEREQKSVAAGPQVVAAPAATTPATAASAAPKLRDYLQQPGVRPAPLGSEQSDAGKAADVARRPYQQPAPPQYGRYHYQYAPPEAAPPRPPTPGVYQQQARGAAYAPYGPPAAYAYAPTSAPNQYVPAAAPSQQYQQYVGQQMNSAYAPTSTANNAYAPPSGTSSFVHPPMNSAYAPPSTANSAYAPPTANATYASPSTVNSAYAPSAANNVYAPSAANNTYASPTANSAYAPPSTANSVYAPSAANNAYASPSTGNIAYAPPAASTTYASQAANGPYAPTTANNSYASSTTPNQYAAPAPYMSPSPYTPGAQTTAASAYGSYPGYAYYAPRDGAQPKAAPQQQYAYAPPPGGAYAAYGGAYAQPPPQAAQQPPPAAPPPRAASNVDLLAGLDFNVSQVPLDPVKAAPHEQRSPSPKVDQENTQTPPPPQKSERPNCELQAVSEPPTDERAFESSVALLGAWVRGGGLDAELEQRWRDLQARQERDCAALSISVARCYPARNRCPESLPYDANRYELPTPPAADDYINASLVPRGARGLPPPLLVTQAPLPATAADFWTMVAHAGCDTVVCLLTDAELERAGFPGGGGYWRAEHGAVVRAEAAREHWTERAVAVGRQGLEVTLFQMTTPWPGMEGETPAVVAAAALAAELSARWAHGCARPTAVHCLTGQGRSGVLCVLLAAAADALRPPPGSAPRLADVQTAAAALALHRRNPLRDRLHLAIAYRALLRLAEGALPPGAPPERREPTDGAAAAPSAAAAAPKDPLSDLDPLWKLKIS